MRSATSETSAGPGLTESLISGSEASVQERLEIDWRDETRSIRAVPRWAAWLICNGAVLVGLLAGHPPLIVLLCLGLCGTIAVAMTPGAAEGSSVVAALPAGFVLVGAWALVWGLAGGILAVDAWGTRHASLLGIVVLTALTGMATRKRGGTVQLVGGDWAAASGFVLLSLFFTWVVVHQPFEAWSRINSSGTDFLRHVGAIRVVRDEGHLRPGEPSYPKALHTLGSWLTSATGIPTDVRTLWTAIAPLGFLMLALMLLGIMVVANRITGLVVETRWPGSVAAGLAALAFVQTAWFTTFLASGSVMNIVVGLCLVALLSFGLQKGTLGAPAGTIIASGAVAVTANAWQLMLPMVGVAAFPWFVAFVRGGRRRAADWFIWGLGGSLVLNGVLGLRNLDSAGQASTPAVSNLFSPDWWWFVAIAISLWLAWIAFRRGQRGWAAMATGMLVSGIGLVVLLMHLTGSSWDLMLYYPVKALWTAMVVVIPMASAGLVTMVTLLWRRGGSLEHDWLGVVLRGVVGLVVGILAVGSMGRGAAFAPHLEPIASGSAGLPNWPVAVVDAMKDVQVPGGSQEGAIVFGLVPSSDIANVKGGLVGMVDFMAMEGLSHAGIEGAMSAVVKVGLAQRDMTQVCRYLEDFPNSLRLTGSNPEAGPQWIIDSGCPRSIVKPEKWIRLQIAPAWLQNSPWQDGTIYRFPSFGEVHAASVSG